jgi:hypothetical protein
MDSYIRDVVEEYTQHVTLRDVPEEFRLHPHLNAHRCPRCGNRCQYRSGMYCDHMRRCGDCNIVWTPDDVERLQRAVSNALELHGGGGI